MLLGPAGGNGQIGNPGPQGLVGILEEPGVCTGGAHRELCGLSPQKVSSAWATQRFSVFQWEDLMRGTGTRDSKAE